LILRFLEVWESKLEVEQAEWDVIVVVAWRVRVVVEVEVAVKVKVIV